MQNLLQRPRRLRQKQWVRDMVSENRLSVKDLIWPAIIIDGYNVRQDVGSMPGVQRLSIDQLLKETEKAAKLGIPCVGLFPFTMEELKTNDGAEALNPDNLICRAVRAIKQEGLDIGVLCDVALDPYTTHGHDGVFDFDKFDVDNDKTVDILTEQSLLLADAGCDIIAPSDMMDGRVGSIRNALEEDGFSNTLIMSYAAKYASNFYGPYREAVGSSSSLGKADKKTYQMDFANTEEALREVELDIAEGADMFMVKPGMPYLDIIQRVKSTFNVPTFAYQVSGEYAMMMAAAQNGWLNEKNVILESLMCFKRAGCDGILSYAAPKVAEWLKENQ